MENGGPAGAEATGILEAGARLGQYEIRRLIGLGSMSAIYEGARPDTGRRVALKVLSPRRAAVPGARARFLTEAKLTARVRHAHIVDVIEVGEDGEQSYLAMEMLEGEDLASRLRQASFLSAAETADILGPVCEAVAAAHESGIVHRDLKPANIFLAIRDQKIHPVVLDFGIANDNDDDDGSGPGPQLVFGTPYYLSPEQTTDHRAASPASDQWALGVILYECLTGARPFDGESLAEVFAAIRAGKAVPPRERRPGIPSALEQIVMRAMSSDPTARFASVAELAKALRPFSSGAAEVRAPARRRAPSSPAIAAEASTQSPFSRTLTPEVDVLDGLWFEPDPPEEASGDVTMGPANLTLVPATLSSSEEASVSDTGRPLSSEAWLTFANRWTERWRSVSGRRFSGRRIGAVAGGVLGGLALLVLITHGGSAKRAGSPQPTAATDRTIAPSSGAPPPPPGGQVSPPPRQPERENSPAKQAPIATEPANEPAAPSSLSAAPVKEPAAVKEPALVKEPAAEEPAVKEPEVAKEPAAAKEPVAAKQPTAMETVAKPRATPAAMRPPKAERHERVTSAPTEAPKATGSAARDTTEKPRVRANPDVRMHNGVPLLD